MTEGRLIAIDLDPASLSPGRSFVDGERAVAIRDLLIDNAFTPAGRGAGDFRLRLSVADGKLVFDVTAADGAPLARHVLSLTPLRRVVKDYFLICEAWQAARASGRSRLEAIDIGRRGLHNEGAALLQERLSGKIAVDLQTARRLFTLVCALHRTG